MPAFATERVRLLNAGADVPAVQGLFIACADYCLLERGEPPAASAASDFFADCPPDRDISSTRKFGAFDADGRLVAIADLAIGFPDESDAFIGLLLFDPALRGQGFGPAFLGYLADYAHTLGSHRLLLAVLEENRRAHAFWEREAFCVIKTVHNVEFGRKTHTVHRMARSL